MSLPPAESDNGNGMITRYFLTAVRVPADLVLTVSPRFTQEDNEPPIGRAELRLSLASNDEVPDTATIEAHIYELTQTDTALILNTSLESSTVVPIASKVFTNTDESYIGDGMRLHPLPIGF